MDFTTFIADFSWLIGIVSTLSITSLLLFLENKYYARFVNATKLTKSIWDDCIIKSLNGPLKIIILFYGIFHSLNIIIYHFSVAELYANLFDIIEILINHAVVLWFSIKFISEVEKSLFKLPKAKRKLDKTTVRAIGQVSTITISVLVVLNVIKPVFGVPISALLAFGGLGGIAVALACQDLLSNIFGGLFIYLDRPFDIGDWISSPEKDIEGTVEFIGMRLTLIRTFDKTLRYIPNSLFSKIIVDNPSRMSHRRIKMTIGIRYDDAANMGKIIKDVDKMIHKNKYIDSEMLSYARFLNFSASSIDFEVYGFTKEKGKADYLTAKEDIATKIVDIINKHNAEMAFPTRTIHLVKDGDQAVVKS